MVGIGDGRSLRGSVIEDDISSETDLTGTENNDDDLLKRFSLM